jgi:hypothetical protein
MQPYQRRTITTELHFNSSCSQSNNKHAVLSLLLKLRKLLTDDLTHPAAPESGVKKSTQSIRKASRDSRTLHASLHMHTMSQPNLFLLLFIIYYFYFAPLVVLLNWWYIAA